MDSFAECSVLIKFFSGCIIAQFNVFLNHNGDSFLLQTMQSLEVKQNCDPAASCVSVGSTLGFLQLSRCSGRVIIAFDHSTGHNCVAFKTETFFFFIFSCLQITSDLVSLGLHTLWPLLLLVTKEPLTLT